MRDACAAGRWLVCRYSIQTLKGASPRTATCLKVCEFLTDSKLEQTCYMASDKARPVRSEQV